MLRGLDKDGEGIEKLRFLTAMLVTNEVCDFERDIEPWLKRFEELDRGTLPFMLYPMLLRLLGSVWMYHDHRTA